MHFSALHKKFVEYLDRQNTTDWSRFNIEKLLNSFLESCPEVKITDRMYWHQGIVSRMWGLGVLDKLFEDDMISEIMVNGSNEVRYEKKGKIEISNICFESDEDVVAMVNRMVSVVGRRLDEATPLVDARLPDGSRLNAIIPPLSRSGPVVTIRRFPKVPFTLKKAVVVGSLTLAMADFLSAAVKAKNNILISGATGSGKTSLLNALAAQVNNGERIITIEDTAEISLTHGHVIQLEARAANIEGRGEISIRTLVRNALRMRPDRIIVGEVRSGEALDMLQAMNTGHQGSLTTVHANSPAEALERLATMALMADLGLPDKAIRFQVANAIAIVIQVARFPDGVRRVAEISEVIRQENSNSFFKIQTLFKYLPEERRFASEKTLPTRLEFFEKAGVDLNPDWFSN